MRISVRLQVRWDDGSGVRCELAHVGLAVLGVSHTPLDGLVGQSSWSENCAKVAIHPYRYIVIGTCGQYSDTLNPKP